MAKKYIFIIIKYPKTETASKAISAMMDLMQKKIVDMKDAVTVTKTEQGEIALHRTQDDLAVEGFLNGRLIGIIFADLFGTASWEMNSTLAGTAFSILGQGIKDKLLDEIGDKLTPAESAVALLLERANWRKALESMRPHNFGGVAVISQNVIEDLTRVEKLLEDEKITTSMPEKISVSAPKGLKYIEGIGDVYRQKLRQEGILNVDDLLEKEILKYVKGRPMEDMAPYIAKQPRIVAAFLVGIAMKESKFGTYSPKLGGLDCHNYWGFKGGGTTTPGGYTCFNSPGEAIQTVGKRIAKLVDSGRTNPSAMVIWKCGSSCSWDNPENVRKWIADVGVNFYKINSKENS
jgi:uncharacterized membrane protein